ncbi:hypothetical protein [Bacillus nitroreducens]
MSENEEFDVKQGENRKSLRGSRFDRLMFGPSDGRVNHDVRKETNVGNQVDGVDYHQLMGQINDIMTSIDNIKPALKELSPLLDFFRKK